MGVMTMWLPHTLGVHKWLQLMCFIILHLFKLQLADLLRFTLKNILFYAGKLLRSQACFTEPLGQNDYWFRGYSPEKYMGTCFCACIPWVLPCLFKIRKTFKKKNSSFIILWFLCALFSVQNILSRFKLSLFSIRMVETRFPTPLPTLWDTRLNKD